MSRRPRPFRVLLIAVLVLLVAGVTTSVASRLDLSSGRGALFAVRASRCTSASATVVLDASSVAVTGIDTACNGKTLQVSVRNDQTIWRVSGTVTGSSLTLATGGAITSVQSVAVTIDTWLIGSQWSLKVVDLPKFSCRAIDNPSARCWVEITASTSWPTPPDYYQVRFNVVTDSPTLITWSVTMNLSHADWPFFAKSLKSNQGGGLTNVTTSGCSATPRTVTFQGNHGWGKDQIQAGRTADGDVVGQTFAGGDLLSC